MRHLLAAACLSAIAMTGLTAASATSAGHWYCTADGIKSWTTDASASDAHGWSYVGGDRATYKGGGHCAKS